MASISPHTTPCLQSPLLPFSVRNPSLPANSSRQSRAISWRIAPASSTWGVVRPQRRHLPTRDLRVESQRGERASVTAVGEGVEEGEEREGWVESLLRWDWGVDIMRRAGEGWDERRGEKGGGQRRGRRRGVREAFIGAAELEASVAFSGHILRSVKL